MAPYEILGLPSTAKREDIKKAYRRLSLRYHPDRPGGDAEKYLVIRDAYECLIKPDTTKIHDQYQHRNTPYANINSQIIDQYGDAIISISFANLICAHMLGTLQGKYYWTLFGMNSGMLVIKKKDLERCGYRFVLEFTPLGGHDIPYLFKFEDPRTKWQKFISKLKSYW